MDKTYNNYEDYKSEHLNYIFGSIFYKKEGAKIVEAKIVSVHEYKILNEDNHIVNEVCVEYITALGKKEQHRARTLNDFPLWRTPSLDVAGDARAFSEYEIKCATMEVCKSLNIRNVYGYGIGYLGLLGSCLQYFIVSDGKVENARAILTGVHFYRNGTAMFNFAEEVSCEACQGRWNAHDIAMFKEGRTYFMDKYNPVPHLMVTQAQAEEKLLSSGNVIRFGDTPGVEEKPDPITALTNTIEEYAKRYGFKAEINFSPLGE